MLFKLNNNYDDRPNSRVQAVCMDVLHNTIVTYKVEPQMFVSKEILSLHLFAVLLRFMQSHIWSSPCKSSFD